MSSAYLPFEKPVEALAQRAAALRATADPARHAEARELDARAARLLADTYKRLTPAQRVQVARHPERPRIGAYLPLFEDFTPLAGDRQFGEDLAIVGGPGRFEGRAVMVIGHAKGEDTAGRVRHNFGMARPEGYRKAVRLMELANRMRMPVIALVDTPGAHPGIDAEERGQAEAIARATQTCLEATVPNVAVILGEGGSGGAVALAAMNRVIMLENAVYSVISPEGAASILWRTAKRAPEAADALKMTAPDLMRLGLIQRIVYEPPGGAHRDPDAAVRRVAAALREALAGLVPLPAAELRRTRENAFLGAR